MITLSDNSAECWKTKLNNGMEGVKMKKRSSIFMMMYLSIIAVSLLPGSSRAAVYEVCTGCAYSTIQEAIDVTVNGDEVLVHPGIYGPIVIHSPDWLNPKSITVSSLNPHDRMIVSGTIIDGGGVQRAVEITGENNGSVLKGFTITGGRTENIGGGIFVGAYANPTIAYNIIKGNWASGGGGAIYVIASELMVKNVLIVNNLIKNNCAAFGSAIAWQNESPQVVRNTIVHNGDKDFCSITQSAAIWAQGGSSGLIKENIVYENSRQVNGQPYYGGIHGMPQGTTVLEYNIVSRNALNEECFGVFIGTNGCMALDPVFVGGDDYRLQCSSGVLSPGVDEGSATPITNNEFDLEGQTRIMDGDSDGIPLVDLGADEFFYARNENSVPGGCQDGIDNDCKGDGIDCADRDCRNDPACAAPPGEPEICDDGIDNDADGKTDCADRDCRNDPACATPPGEPEICNDGIDNDGDGKTDCADRDCRNDPACAAPPGEPEICNDTIDNDGDGDIDCADRDCRKDPAC